MVVYFVFVFVLLLLFIYYLLFIISIILAMNDATTNDREGIVAFAPQR